MPASFSPPPMAERVICDGGVKAPDRDILAHCVYPGWYSDAEQSTPTHPLTHTLEKGIPQIVGQGCFRGLAVCMDIYVCICLHCFSVCVCVCDCHWFLSGQSTTSSTGLQGGHVGEQEAGVGEWLNNIHLFFLLSSLSLSFCQSNVFLHPYVLFLICLSPSLPTQHIHPNYSPVQVFFFNLASLSGPHRVQFCPSVLSSAISLIFSSCSSCNNTQLCLLISVLSRYFPCLLFVLSSLDTFITLPNMCFS